VAMMMTMTMMMTVKELIDHLKVHAAWLKNALKPFNKSVMPAVPGLLYSM
jgi:hypothetical protein